MIPEVLHLLCIFFNPDRQEKCGHAVKVQPADSQIWKLAAEGISPLLYYSFIRLLDLTSITLDECAEFHLNLPSWLFLNGEIVEWLGSDSQSVDLGQDLRDLDSTLSHWEEGACGKNETEKGCLTERVILRWKEYGALCARLCDMRGFV